MFYDRWFSIVDLCLMLYDLIVFDHWLRSLFMFDGLRSLILSDALRLMVYDRLFLCLMIYDR